MKYVCQVCGYVYDEEAEGVPFAELPDSWTCPMCKAPKSMFAPEESEERNVAAMQPASIDADMLQLSPGALAALFSNLARGAEKQYMEKEPVLFRRITEYFAAVVPSISDADINMLRAISAEDIDNAYPQTKAIASSKGPIQLPLEYYEPIFNFCKDHRVHSYAEVLDTFADKDVNGYHITEDNVLEVLQNLTLSNTIMPAAAPEALSPEIIERTKHFNRVILLEEPDSPIKFLVSPITQSGMYFNDVLRALLREYMRDSNVSPEQLKKMLAKRTEGLQVSDEIKKKIDDKQLTMEDMINETVDKFFSDYLPLYKSLEII